MNYDDKQLKDMMRRSNTYLVNPTTQSMSLVMQQLDALIAAEMEATLSFEATQIETRLLGDTAPSRELSEKSVAFVVNEGSEDEVTILLTAQNDNEGAIITGELLVDDPEDWQKTNVLLYVDKGDHKQQTDDETDKELHDYYEVDSKLGFSLKLTRLNEVAIKIVRPDLVVIWLKDLTVRLS